MSNQKQNGAILRLPEVRKKTGLPTSTIYYLMKKGQFPHGVKLGARAVGWLEDEIIEWLSERILDRNNYFKSDSEVDPV